jgi:hypothetical protein
MNFHVFLFTFGARPPVAGRSPIASGGRALNVNKIGLNVFANRIMIC